MNTRVMTTKTAKRLDSWVEIQDHIKKNGLKTKGKALIISSQYGCDAYSLAESLQADIKYNFGETWNIYDDELFDLVSKDEKISKRVLQDFNSSYHLFDYLSPFMNHWETSDQLYRAIGSRIVELAKHGQCIIINHGSSYLTQRLDNTIQIRLEANTNNRADLIAHKENVSFDEAKELIKREDRKEKEFIHKFLGLKDIEDMDYYQLKINTSKLSQDQMLSIVNTFLQ